MASEQEIIEALQNSDSGEVRIKILDQLGHRIKPQHRKLIKHLVELSQSEKDEQVAYSVRRALFQIRSRYNITNFALFLMDPLTLLQSSDPAYRLKALETFETQNVSLEQCYYFLGSLHFETDAYVLNRMLKVLPKIKHLLPPESLRRILQGLRQHEDERIQKQAQAELNSLFHSPPMNSLDTLWQGLGDKDQRVREQAIRGVMQEPREQTASRIQKSLQFSQDYYLLESCLILCEQGNFSFEEHIISQAKESLNRARGSQEDSMVMPALISPIPENTVTSFDKVKPLGRALIIVLVLQSLLIINLSKTDQTVSLPQAESLQVQVQKETGSPPVFEAESSLADREDKSLKEKIEMFQNQGRLLRENADRFLTVANQKYDQEAYDEANQLYMSLYEVYKDNRMAVDAVRLLSRTQKVQNILESVKEYVSKKQYISAVKKLEEIKHLVSAELFRKHYDSIEAERILHQEGNQNP
ncbi:MAG: hypothetical protein H3C47_12440 [Candidatus Cloacimonetes bacterium]|nr:hypothetical protein [Candidatus Cloacimonadota bacterium]